MTRKKDGATEAARHMFDADRAARGLGIELLEIAEGSAVLRMTVTADMVNGHGIAHGGCVFLLADTAFACACNSHGPVTVAAAADIDFVRRGDDVVAEFRGRSRTLRPAPD
ncbi:hotdog fold thioesterase [Streptomyces sp. NPDC094149]|uniref:hotdog fold thioesterase n=1 Tax=Streptomyces sp. NPDC094149 TaxID=3155079 RepID=UPI003330C98A